MNEVLLRLATEADYRPPRWNEADIAAFRLLVQCARAAAIESDLRNMRLLQLRPNADGGPDTALARLGSSRDIVLTFKGSDSHPVAVFELLTSETEAPR